MSMLARTFSLNTLTLFFSWVLLLWLLWYFYTGSGGPQELVSRLMSIALILQILFMYRNDYLYKWLPPRANDAIVAVYIGICLYAFYYFWFNFEDVAIYRQGSYSRQDFIVGLLVFLLVMELSRLAHPTLFWINFVLVIYTMYGYWSPLDFFWHPGTTFYRVVTSSTVEFSTGIYGIYGQLALTLVAAFLTLAAAAHGFGAQAAMINVMRRLAGRNRQMIPQTAVLGSLAVGTVSGSGSANAVVVGSITIPLMKRYGVPGAFAAAVETAASMGGLLMPPLMGVGAFLMSEFLGVPYWDVVARGFGLALTYYIALSFAVYLLCVRLLPGTSIKAPTVLLYETVKTSIFFLSVAFLIVLMGWIGIGELRAALYTAAFMFALLIAAFLYFKHIARDPTVQDETLWRNIMLSVETHADMTSYLTLLLATLGIMIGLFTVTGFINRMGGMLLDLGSVHLTAVIGMAYFFGWLVGAGLPPTATYIIGAVVIVGPLTKLGVDPWVAHFFVFLISVWGELSPPTSLTAAISARIAEASFMRTMWEALKICLPITLMTFSIFARPEMVTTTGWPQFAAALLVIIGVCGVAFAMFGRTGRNVALDIGLRIVLAVFALVTLMHPDDNLARMTAVVTAIGMVAGVWRHRIVAPPESTGALDIEDDETAPRSKLQTAKVNLVGEG
ncbi:TRAP transporter fused permease subunit [Bradyrhizobium sp.]|uniref:TRAP transporter fused permease subunit n=1 Tax=Bradyrhizobium sp. TaxID=376 RepID=UPI0027355BFC|nr:TRAP transporter fused permease subunit [Bradyrhizobium sp.]MDP3693767.1 TRAP transporter fused permease subunit [Bradyrhizobium sp.]